MIMAKQGRPSGYKPEYCEQARKLCELGATDIEIADFFDVAVRTLYDWKAAHADFLQALKEGKAEADARVVESLYQRAVGYTHDAEKIFNHDGKVTRVKYREHYPPDTTACIFWLKNRQPGHWRDKQDHVHSPPPEPSDRDVAKVLLLLIAEAKLRKDPELMQLIGEFEQSRIEPLP
jgi:hypothetical protein